jgi:UDP-GlcNAc:undecaprenyl-phosphate/decaprenyl-phosphate GlcNAc-1-phosphate transferase
VKVTAILLTLLGALALSAALTPIVRAIARRTGFLARPHSARWHREAVPLFGGCAIAVSFAIATMAATPLGPLAPLLVATGLMFGLGALDDVLHFSASTKLVVQAIVAGVVVYLMPPSHVTGFVVLDALVALVWIVGITNAFNLLDNIDGLSAGIAAVAGIFLLAALSPSGLSPLSLAVAAFVGAALGFLVFNVRPATIFMGDGGSLFLGSFLASAALLAAPELKAGIVPVAAIPLFILLIPIFDTAFVSVTRRLAGRSPLHGGRDHLSHRLVALGIDERRAVLGLYMLAALGGVIALSLQHADFGYAAILIALYIILLAGIGIVLGHVEAHSTPEGADSTARPPLVSEVAYQNRWYEVLLDLALVSLAYYAAFRFRFRGEAFAHFLTYFAGSFPLVLACQMAGLAIAGKYRQVWRSFGAQELIGIIKGVWIGVASSALVILYLPYRFEGFSRLVFAIDAVVLASLLVGARLAITSADEYLRRRRGVGRPVLIYGAGGGGALLVRTLLEDRTHALAPVGFIDDDATKRRLRLEGVPVLGTFDDLSGLFVKHGVSEVIVSIKALDRRRLAEVAAVCREQGVTVRSMRFALEEIGPVPTVRHAQSR